MINTTEIQIQAALAELKAQRSALGDRAADLAVELAATKAEKQFLEGRVKNLEERLEKLENSGSADGSEGDLGDRSEAAPLAGQ